MKKFYIIVPLIFLYFWGNSQTGFTTYTEPVGYTTAQLRYKSGIGIDASNNKWVAYKSVGLGKFDGTTWTMYDTTNSVIPSSCLTSLLIDGNNVYAGTIKGLGIYNGSSTWTNYNTSSGLPDNNVNAVNFKSGNLWVGTNKGIAEYNGSVWKYYNTLNSAIANDTITSIEIAGNDTIWIGTINGLSCLISNVFTNYDTLNSGLKSNYITCLKNDINNNLWIGTKATGAYKMSSNVIKPLTTLYPNIISLNNNLYISSIALNNNDILIVGDLPANHQCIFKINHVNYSYVAYIAFGSSFSTPYYLCSDANKIIWFVTGPTIANLRSLDCLIATMYDNFDFLSINNIEARFNAGGQLFWDEESLSNYYAPKGSGKTSIFSGALWIGGRDTSGKLHIAAERYEQYGKDFFPGPIMDSIYYQQEQEKWNRVWKLDKTDIDYLKANYMNPGYVAPPSIADWPAIGDTTLGESYNLAPFYDNNGDGKYNPYDGDYPLIKGDEAVLFIMNDTKKSHTETGGNKLGIQIIAMAYAFECNEDSAFWNTIFLNYKITNFSSLVYDSTLIGTFIDTDIGYAADDYIGCDVQRSSFYGYNGKNIDGIGQAWAYGAYPPAQAVTILAGPYLAPDGIDNPLGICDASVNGFGFGDGVVDNERYGMTRFVYFTNVGATSYGSDPVTPMDYYNYLQGKWIDSTQILYGGNGHIGAGAYGPACNFMFPGNSDTCNWGTGGIAPYGPKYWTDSTAGNQPDDRRGLGVSGPFTFKPHEQQELDLAFVFGRNYNDTNATAAIPVIDQRIDSIRKHFQKGLTTPCKSFAGIASHQQTISQLDIYPNPTSDNLTIEVKDFRFEILELKIYNIVGNLILEKTLNNKVTNIDVSTLAKGMYFVKVKTENGVESRKFVKL